MGENWEDWGRSDQLRIRSEDEEQWSELPYIGSSGLPEDLHLLGLPAADWPRRVMWPELRWRRRSVFVPIQLIKMNITRQLLNFIPIWYDEFMPKIYNYYYDEYQRATRSRSMRRSAQKIQVFSEDWQMCRSSTKLPGLLGLHAVIKGLLPNTFNIWLMDI